MSRYVTSYVALWTTHIRVDFATGSQGSVAEHGIPHSQFWIEQQAGHRKHRLEDVYHLTDADVLNSIQNVPLTQPILDWAAGIIMGLKGFSHLNPPLTGADFVAMATQKRRG
ncbi:hypothetical protein MMC11_007500 [Xylographa trunciseda]|nr:hypothetical protein [Xylographa trunciseda]